MPSLESAITRFAHAWHAGFTDVSRGVGERRSADPGAAEKEDPRPTGAMSVAVA
jgi:hypothetical protein